MRIITINPDQTLNILVSQADIEALVQIFEIAGDTLAGTVPVPAPTDDTLGALLETYSSLIKCPQLIDESNGQQTPRPG